MKHKKTKLIQVLMLFSVLTELLAQNGITISGNTSSGKENSVSYSTGQMNYIINKESSGSLTHGIIQAYFISTVNETEKAISSCLFYSTTPIPTTDYLILKIEYPASTAISDFRYEHYDTNGKLNVFKKLESNETVIDLDNLIPATYYLKVLYSENNYKTFKIIKTI
jgi:hypothetical protein